MYTRPFHCELNDSTFSLSIFMSVLAPPLPSHPYHTFSSKLALVSALAQQPSPLPPRQVPFWRYSACHRSIFPIRLDIGARTLPIMTSTFLPVQPPGFKDHQWYNFQSRHGNIQRDTMQTHTKQSCLSPASLRLQCTITQAKATVQHSLWDNPTSLSPGLCLKGV